MKINPMNSASMINKYKETVRKNNISSAKSLKSDNFEISSSGKAFAAALEAVRALPETRDEYVSEIKERVMSGRYEINSRSIAEKILKNMKIE